MKELKIKRGGRVKGQNFLIFSPFSKHSDVLMDATDEEMDGEGMGALNLKCLKLIPPSLSGVNSPCFKSLQTKGLMDQKEVKV